MEIKRIEGEIEAILFAMGEAVELSRIAKSNSAGYDYNGKHHSKYDDSLSGRGSGNSDY